MGENSEGNHTGWGGPEGRVCMDGDRTFLLPKKGVPAGMMGELLMGIIWGTNLSIRQDDYRICMKTFLKMFLQFLLDYFSH